MEKIDLRELQEIIRTGYVFDEKTYPELKGLTFDQDVIIGFGIRHSLHHMQKAIGRIAGYVEAQEHGGSADPGGFQFLQETVKKEFVNVMKLAELVGISAEELSSFVKEKYK